MYEMIDHTFLLPAKMIFCRSGSNEIHLMFRATEREGKVFAFLKRSEALVGLDSAIVKQGRTGAKRSVKIGGLFPGERGGVFNL